VYENLQMQERTYLRNSVTENFHYFRAQREKSQMHKINLRNGANENFH
jgi:hypothetical protein